MSTSITIRAATLRDISSLVALLDELNREEEGYPTSIGSDDLASVLFGEKRLVQMQAFVAESGGAIVGAVLYYWGFDTVSASFGFHLADIIVTKTARRKSIGKQLFTALAADCLQQGGQWISLTVLKQNTLAKQYYHALGLTQVEVDFFAIGPQALTRLIRK